VSNVVGIKEEFNTLSVSGNKIWTTIYRCTPSSLGRTLGWQEHCSVEGKHKQEYILRCLLLI